MFERFETPVRCSAEHLYTTIWIPGGSLKGARLGWNRRYQRCPVGRHWAMTYRLKDAAPEQLQEAAKVHDSRIP